ncbi:hypothetical protein AK830_g11449 [Neonectria ditissima]|uniref:Uncharacterized protein n=1 Tax=Neonectria ditissima TaxID=78410 RepID=A0A0P7AMF9_9HYPO|nr:hypothetical protein AK830_g11449 [Neonectria ditissima]
MSPLRTLPHYLSGELKQEPNPEFKPGLSLVMKWTKAELRNRLPPSLKPKAWAKIAASESRLFGSKPKPPPQEEEKRSSWSPKAESKSATRTHRRAKSEIIDRTEVEPHDDQPEVPEMPKLPPVADPVEAISMRSVTRKTVDEVFDGSTALESYAQSVDLSVHDSHEESPSKASSLDGRPSNDEIKFEEAAQQAALEADRIDTGISQDQVQKKDTELEDSGEGQSEDFCVPCTSNPDRDEFVEFHVPPHSLVDNAVRNRVWGLNISDLISAKHDREPTEIPNCTASHHTNNWRVTTSSLKAYTAMRGPYRHAGRDMFVWMDRCGKTFDRPEECDEHVGSCNSIITDLEPLSYDPTPLQDDSNRKDVFSVPRPPYQHIKPPPTFKSEDHEEPIIEITQKFIKAMKKGVEAWTDDGDGHDLARPANPNEFYSCTDDFFISDDEGDPLDGRISPCTFRLWAEGCERWDSDKPDADGIPDSYYQRIEELKVSERERRGGPSMQPHGYHMSDDGEESLEYVIMGYNAQCVPIRLSEWHRELADRLNATALYNNRQNELQNHQAGADKAKLDSPCDLKPYTDSEVLAALNADDARVVNGISPRDAEAMLAQRYGSLQQRLEAEQNAFEQIAATEKRVSRREAQLERVSTSVNTILELKANKVNHRREEIYRHVSQHLRELEAKGHAKDEETWEMANQLANLLTKEMELEAKMREEARKVGLDDITEIDEVERALQHLLVHATGSADAANDSFF